MRVYAPQWASEARTYNKKQANLCERVRYNVAFADGGGIATA